MTTDYELVAGIETHVQLETPTKLFCGCAIKYGAPPNSSTCPVCLGHPGTLPVLSARALELAIRAALALNCSIAPVTKFDRKNYYYPDLPKNYQISQFDVPLSFQGWVEIPAGTGVKRIRIHRAHLEEDAGKLIHEENGTRSFVDLNRAGVPLLEIVTEPDLRSAEEAHAYLDALKAILQYAGVSGCDMEKGQLRCDVNVSIRPRGTERLGTKIEVKNLNSFRYVQKAIEYEFVRQRGELEAGRTLVQSTHLFDPKEEKTRLMRIKEGATDYRYFPEPDLPPLVIPAADVERIRAALPELPGAKRDRLVREFGVGIYEAGVLTSEQQVATWFEAAIAAGGKAKAVANWMVNELARILNETKRPFAESKLRPAGLVEILALLDAGTITAASAKEILAAVVESGRPPADLVKERGLAIVTDTGEIEKAVADVIAANPKAVADFKGGKDATIKFLVGAVMKATRGRVKATTAEELLRKLLL